MVCFRVMKFYGWSWRQLQDTPISAIWKCHKYVERLRAEDMLTKLFLHGYSTMGEEQRNEYVDGLKEAAGRITVETEVFDRSGLDTLKALSQL